MLDLSLTTANIKKLSNSGDLITAVILFDLIILALEKPSQE
jgi:hypothetical protein